ncbi:hypothetical protein MMC14_008008 [Varicellaria rhodocarpa]|nr:hypothetical protein [Varicellaria rhodocarpa]
MDAQEVALIATGAGKARAVKMGIEGGVNHLWTISALQQHPQCLMVVDEAACQELMMKTVKYFKQVEKTALDSASDRNMSIIPSSVLNLGGQGFQKAKL